MSSRTTRSANTTTSHKHGIPRILAGGLALVLAMAIAFFFFLLVAASLYD